MRQLISVNKYLSIYLRPPTSRKDMPKWMKDLDNFLRVREASKGDKKTNQKPMTFEQSFNYKLFQDGINQSYCYSALLHEWFFY